MTQPTAAAPPLQALVFDAFGTLYDVTSVGALCEELFPGHGPQITEVWRVKQLEYSWLCSLMGRYRDFEQLTEAALRFACAQQGVQLTAAHQERLMGSYQQLATYAEVPAALERLSKRLPLAILSNGTPGMLKAVTEHNGLQAHLRAVISVDELQIFKPSPRVYALAAEQLQVPVEGIGFVSSNAWDACGAKAHGLRVFWINRFNRTPETLEWQPDHTIRTLDDLDAFLP